MITNNEYCESWIVFFGLQHTGLRYALVTIELVWFNILGQLDTVGGLQYIFKQMQSGETCNKIFYSSENCHTPKQAIDHQTM